MEKLVLSIFVILRFAQYLAEKYLSGINHQYYRNKQNQHRAMEALSISDEEMAKTLSYSEDKFKFGVVSSWVNITAMMLFLVCGGLGYFEKTAKTLARSYESNQIFVGVIFFLLLGLTFSIYSIPFQLYDTFVVEQRHGFNRQSWKGFFSDWIKTLLIGSIIGTLLLSTILFIMEKTGQYWWVWAWLAASCFSIITAYIYPSLLAPLFNKFSPLPEGELKEKIFELAKKVGFRTSGVFVMDASKRSAHGNAYFTGIFGKKRIVLFDTLLNSVENEEVVAVLAHELGHFKLHHIRWGLIRGLLFSALTFFLLSLFLPYEIFYKAFFFSSISNYAALIVFSMWFGLLDFWLDPIENYISRRNEFAADRFAINSANEKQALGRALLKLREKSKIMPLTHPLYSSFYYSHPPLLERLRAMGFFN